MSSRLSCCGFQPRTARTLSDFATIDAGSPGLLGMRLTLKFVPVTFPILLDPANGVSKLYNVSAMPSTVIVDRKGAMDPA